MGGADSKPLQLTDRSQHLLKTLVEAYIREGQPVGSRVLARESGLDLSPATVRNVMADLEDMGLVRSPHTSAGRVPTVHGYRLFVDTLLTVKPLQRAEVKQLSEQLIGDLNREELLSAASRLLSEVTHLAGLVTVPRGEQSVLRQVEFLPLRGNQVLVILVVNEREVQNRIIHTQRRYTQPELERSSNYLNARFAGRGLEDVRQELLREMREHREDMQNIMSLALEMADKALVAEESQDDFVVAGQTNLMEYVELSDLDKLRHLFEAFNRKRDILYLLDQALKAKGVQIFIGEESGYEALDECSVVTSAYAVDDHILGVLGVIGPTRMAYERVIPIVELTARLLGAALNRSH
ncbi:MAG: heat-inducible transcriptional repressor HrcA [Gammaproteobacteria bacterium]|nr:heat-inducible transcriptional repressor HrcA [Gammaproteobacteria bacterium]NIR82837.1 heat-inducible transcriptional repressor HrcA [Gammaproteobacteria bacterium]NIR89946.1 heat-inducible transcriptional repressor HrcA [Gammaproteobacteria bacterium]NIU03995.1 heat-inducible transcriptional repressor HrcA [Gammaproteobacteria bacterium]NIV51315.1 heat-inducible transcriptional repressor HrcA [Gammaproteobacteria bacterium]